MVVNGENVIITRETVVVYWYILSQNFLEKPRTSENVMMQTISRHK